MSTLIFPVPAGATEMALDIAPQFTVPPPETNLPPVADAGNDIVITLPVNSVILKGSANDPEGSPVTVTWEQTTGPTTAFIEKPHEQETPVKELIEGTYTFLFHVKDNKGLEAISAVICTVKPVITVPPVIKYQGYGAGATGGTGKQIVYVTNLNSSGSGSLAAAIGSNRIVSFEKLSAGGTIVGRFNLAGCQNLTIDGSTAPAPGITIDNRRNGDAISFNGSNCYNVILTHLRATNAGNDGINVIDGAHDILIANCSSYNNRDGNIDIVAGAYYVTVQDTILGSGNTESFSGDMLITAPARYISVHHNLFAVPTPQRVGERCPLVHANYGSAPAPMIDFRNNLIWRWGRNAGTGSGYATAICYNATGNVVNNYYYSDVYADAAINSDDGYGNGANGKVYASGNVSGNAKAINAVSNASEFPVVEWARLQTQSACEAARDVLQNVGPQFKNSLELGWIKQVVLKEC